MVVHAFNPRTLEAEASRVPKKVLGQAGLHSELSQAM